MRPGQNKRMRGRNNNSNNSGGGNRRGPNPLTRSYESNGPDVKIRGTAHHIGEKYLQLARDAQSSGDPVMAESYLQHAEHYFRLIATAQQAQQQAQFGYQRQAGDPIDQDDDGDDEFDSLPDRFASPTDRTVQPTPVPSQDRQSAQDRSMQDRSSQDRQSQDRQSQDRQPQDRQPYEHRGDRGNGQHQPNGQGNLDRQNDRPRFDRQNSPERNAGAAPMQNPPNGSREENAPRDYDNRNFRNRRDERQPRGEFRDNGQPRDQSRDARASVPDEQPSVGLPAFITAPTRVPQDQVVQPDLGTTPPPVAADGEAGDHMRPRRRRRPKPEFSNAEASEAGGQASVSAGTDGGGE